MICSGVYRGEFQCQSEAVESCLQEICRRWTHQICNYISYTVLLPLWKLFYHYNCFFCFFHYSFFIIMKLYHLISLFIVQASRPSTDEHWPQRCATWDLANTTSTTTSSWTLWQWSTLGRLVGGQALVLTFIMLPIRFSIQTVSHFLAVEQFLNISEILAVNVSLKTVSLPLFCSFKTDSFCHAVDCSSFRFKLYAQLHELQTHFGPS